MRVVFAVGVALGSMLIPTDINAQSTFPQDKICKKVAGEEIVDKDALATYLVKTFPINAIALPDSGRPIRPSEIPRRLLANPKTCASGDVCSTQDSKNLEDARGAVRFMMDGRDPRFVPTARVTAIDYFSTPDDVYKIRCVQAGGPAPKPPALVDSPLSKSKSELRIRGKTDDLYVRRLQKEEFKAASAATINFTTDAVANKSTATVQGVVGYAVPVGDSIDLIPYVQINTSAVRTGSGTTGKAKSAETYSAGFVASAYFFTAPMSHLVNFRPDILMNTDDDSQIASLNVQYIPILNGVLNDFIGVGTNFLSFKPVLDFRWNNGWFLNEGVGSAQGLKEDFSRIGGLAGVVIVSDNKNIPLTASSTYLLLRDLYRGPDIGYFANTLTFHLDPDKYFGISASYLSGRREDTGKDEHVWKLGLTGKF